MNARVSLQLPSHTFLALAAYLQESGSGADIEDLAATAIGEWVVQARTRASAGGAGLDRGYQWKGLFLPSGSMLRMSCGGESRYAEVQGDEIIFDGRSVSPAQMANAVGGGTRNAWRDLWVRCPGETAWKLASVRRRQSQHIDGALAAPQPAPSIAAAPAMAPAPAEALLRRLALLLEQTLDARQPQYRRRSDALGECGSYDP
jgi:hypothetical protein